MSSTSFHIGARSQPWLKDHAVQNVAIAPGSLFVDLALSTWRARGGERGPARLKVEFPQPLVIGAEDSEIRIESTVSGSDLTDYTFVEAGGGAPCAVVHVSAPGPSDQTPGGTLPIAMRSLDNDAALTGEKFYENLSSQGNDYGPAFRGVERIWSLPGEALGRLSVPPRDAAGADHALDPVLLDSAIQVLASFDQDTRETFVLRGIDEVIVHRPGQAASGWVRASLRESSGGPSANISDIEIYDDKGLSLITLRGVRFGRIKPAGRGPGAAPSREILVAATFTAEPIREVLEFWSGFLGLSLRASFAPYNQVFQQLLDPASELHRNRAGYNVILVDVADWFEPGAKEDESGYPLPNGLRIAHLNRHETDYVYQEIFEDRCYLRHGIHLPPAATVIDIGANIGLFSLFVRSERPDATVYAFEPNPAAFAALRSNCDKYGKRLHAFNLGVSERRGAADLTFYESSSVFSSFHPDENEDRKAIEAVATNLVRGAIGGDAAAASPYVDELLAHRLDHRTVACQLVSVSDIMRDNGIARVDLLKIDAEKCELEILKGIVDADWNRIGQIVVEVHDRSGRLLAEVQELLEGRGFRCAVEEEKFLTGSGLFNVYAVRDGSEKSPATAVDRQEASLPAAAEEFVRAIEAADRTLQVPTIVCFCPSQRSSHQPERATVMEATLLNRIRVLSRIHAIGSNSILAHYPCENPFDEHANALGHIPYSPEGFAAIGTGIIRTLAALQRAPFKVIAIDCDNTLWRGVCGEDGALGVHVEAGHRELQAFLRRQLDSGMLLCLCSKNNESDVREVFERNPGMVLKWEDLAAVRVNWRAKSENLHALARELNVGVDSVILIDDNAVECADVRANCPGAIALHLNPEGDPAAINRKLAHTWAFDHASTTVEDRARTRLVHQARDRENYRQSVPTLKEFIAGLQLEIQVSDALPEQFERIAQLTFRTNQFNTSTVRRSAGDVAAFLQDPQSHCLTVEVRDRFGDYGLVGAMFYRVEPDSYRVDSLLLSCRALGRGVEHRFVSELGRRAIGDGKPWMEFVRIDSGRNRPALDFLADLGALPNTGEPRLSRFPTADIANASYEPDRTQHQVQGIPASASNARTPDFRETGNQLDQIASGYSTARQIAAAARPQTQAEKAPATLAGRIQQLWGKVLGNPRIGLDDNFFEAGGTSLNAVQILAALRREMNISLPVVAIFERPTVRGLLEKIEGTERSGASDAMARGQRRKIRARKQPQPADPTLA